MEIDQDSEQKQSANSEHKQKRRAWTNDDRIELLRLRLQGLTFEDIGQRMNRTKHAARSEYGRIRRGEVDAKLSLAELPGLRALLPLRKRQIHNTVR